MYPLKCTPANVDKLDSMIRITLIDGSQLEIPREEALELVPYRHVLVSAHLKSPAEGLLCHRGKLIPVLGPLPDSNDGKSVDKRAWILLIKGCAQVIQGLPNFQEAGEASVHEFPTSTAEENEALSELDELLKSA